MARRALLGCVLATAALPAWSQTTPASAGPASAGSASAGSASAGPASPALIEDLVAANRILFDQGVVDGFGHVSVRHDKEPRRYPLARSMAPGLVTADDVMEYDLDSTPIDAKGRNSYLERFIHGEIYKLRPDIIAVVHSHSRRYCRSPTPR